MRSRKADNRGMSDVDVERDSPRRQRPSSLRPRQRQRVCPVRVCPTVYACSLPCTCSCPVGKRVYWLIASFLPSARLPIGSAINRYAPGYTSARYPAKAFRSLYATRRIVHTCIYVRTLGSTTLLNNHLFRLESGRRYGDTEVGTPGSPARDRRCFVTGG